MGGSSPGDPRLECCRLGLQPGVHVDDVAVEVDPAEPVEVVFPVDVPG
jgi:hypothetical protein